MEGSKEFDTDKDGKAAVKVSYKVEGSKVILSQELDLLEIGDEAWAAIQEARSKKA